MQIDGLENLKLADLQDVFKCDEMSYRDAMPFMREFRDKHGLNDQSAIKAFSVARRIFAD